MIRRPNLHCPGALLGAVFLFAMILSGCDAEKTRNLLDERAGEAQQSLTQARDAQPNAKHYNPLVVTDKIWEGDAAMRMHRGLPLPARYETPRGITVIAGQPLPISDIADAITSQTGIPVRVSDIGGRGHSSSSGSSSSSTPAFGSTSSLPSTGSSSSANSSGTSNDGMLVSYEGPLSGLLERVAGYFGVNWRYDGTSIIVAKFETRVFVIEALPGVATTADQSEGSASAGSSSGGGSSGGGSGGSSGGSSGGGSGGSSSSGGSITGSLTQSVNYTGTIKYWDELKESLTAMLGGVGTIITTPSNGEVTVTTTPEIMQMISNYLEQENKRLSRQIAINVEVYNVDMERDSDFNVSFSAAIGRLGNVVNIKTVTGAGQVAPATANPLNGLGTLSIAILNPDHGGGRIGDVFQALSTVGDTSTVAQFPVTTLNNRPVSRFVGTTKFFVPSLQSSTVTGTSSSSSTSAQAQPISSGITLQMTPRLLDDGRMILQYSLNIQTIDEIDCFNVCTGSLSSSCGTSSDTSQGCVIQEPKTENRSFIQQSVLRSGSTLIIGGVDQEYLDQQAQGVGDPFNWLLGGGNSNSGHRTMVFVAITPQVLDPPAAEQGL